MWLFLFTQTSETLFAEFEKNPLLMLTIRKLEQHYWACLGQIIENRLNKTFSKRGELEWIWGINAFLR